MKGSGEEPGNPSYLSVPLITFLAFSVVYLSIKIISMIDGNILMTVKLWKERKVYLHCYDFVKFSDVNYFL